MPDSHTRDTRPAPHRTVPGRAPLRTLGAMVLGLALAGLAPAPALAQLTVSLNTGATLPTGDYADYHSLSYNGAATVDIVVSEHIAVGARVDYHRAGLDGGTLLRELGFGGLPLAVEGGASQLFVMPVARLFQRVDNAEFYAIGGVGWARATEEDVVIFGRGTSERFPGRETDVVGTQLAIGARLPGGPFSIFGEVGYVAAFTDPVTTALPLRIGLAYAFGWEP